MGEQENAEPATKRKKKSRKRLLAIPLVLLVVAGVGYKLVLAPKPTPPKLKIEGTIVPLAREFIVNLEEGRYGKISVALVVEEMIAGTTEKATEPIVLPEEPVIRAIITDHLTGLASAVLTERTKREKLLTEILESIRRSTDEKISRVYFTDIAVQ